MKRTKAVKELQTVVSDSIPSANDDIESGFDYNFEMSPMGQAARLVGIHDELKKISERINKYLNTVDYEKR